MARGFNGMLAYVAPGLALRREVASAKLDVLQEQRRSLNSNYAPVGGGRRSKQFYKNSADANSAMRGAREPLSYIARDMLRNNPRVVRANNLIAGKVVGSGIRPVVRINGGEDQKTKDLITGLIEDHLLTTAIDADGNSTLLGLQALLMKATPTSGEVFLRRRFRRASDGLPLPFQIQCLETDYLAKTKNGNSQGRKTEGGIEYGPTGRADAYWLYGEHPGSSAGTTAARRVDAENIAHGFVIDRPGQRRGVSWYAPVMPELMDIHSFMQGTLKRQEVAAMFAGVITKSDATDDPEGEAEEFLKNIEAGGIIELDGGDDLKWNDPPNAMDAEPVARLIDRVIATGLMLSYESFTGDYSRVNYTSARMGRMDEEPMTQFLQNELVVAKMMAPVTRWFKEAVYFKTFIDPDSYRLQWTPPVRPVVDPTKDYPALAKKVRSGLATRSDVIRQFGGDPDRINNEWRDEARWADQNGLIFDTDPRRVSLSGVMHGAASSDEPEREESETEDE